MGRKGSKHQKTCGFPMFSGNRKGQVTWNGLTTLLNKSSGKLQRLSGKQHYKNGT